MRKIIFILSLAILSIEGYSQNANQNFEIKGIITKYNNHPSSKKVNDVTIKVYHHNEVIHTYQNDKKGKFNFEIPKDAYITLAFEKENYITKRVLFDTRTTDDSYNKDIRPFDLEIVLLQKMEGIDYSELDFPITKIVYVKEFGEYHYAQEYTQGMLKSQEDILLKMDNLFLSQK